MSTLLSIGEFSRLTHLSVKALRHYDDVGLLQPADVDASSGYRRYAAAQVPVAHVIRRFRDLDMPLDRIRTVLEAPDASARDEAIISHLQHMESILEETQATVASLRALLQGGEPTLPVEYRSVTGLRAIAIRGTVEWDDTHHWLVGALTELYGALADRPDARCGPDAALYSPEFFEAHTGEVIAYVPVMTDLPVTGRAELVDIPGADLAVILHEGPFDDLDKAYGALGTFVAERAIGADGPIREHYLVSVADDPADLRTEVAWPVSVARSNG
jgi:DNA-binding transcriptional MerR regulator/effector-binding domain-containing protein